MRHLLALAGVIAACALAGVIAIGCLGKPRFECANDNECRADDGNGTCESDGFCSFADSSCPSGRRYGDLSGPQANECVPIPPDAAPDAFVPDAYVHDARECFGGSGAYELCFDMMPPMGDVTLAGTLDTTNDARCVAMPASWMTAGQPDACMIMGKLVTVESVMVTGTRPLVILGDAITISGTLDVASHRGQPAGPGAPSAACTAFPTAPATNVTGAGGGAGGSFMRAGGNGGNGSGSAGGVAPPALTVSPTVLRAGCSGQTGGTGLAPAGAVGDGGGAVFLTASRIAFTGSGAINASGAGATAADMFAGGSGGGSGGMIVLHAAETITAASGARVIANGGGGASGAVEMAVGDSGDDPLVSMPTSPARGGDAGNGAGVGGDGFAGGTNATPGQGASGQRETGGGGGGGAGFIQTNRPLTGATVSPAATVIP